MLILELSRLSSAHHQQQQQYEQQRSYAQMSHDNGGYTIQQLGNPMDVNQQHMQSVAQQYELANRGSLEGWTQKTSPPQAALAASPSGESDDSDDSSAQNQVSRIFSLLCASAPFSLFSLCRPSRITFII